MTMKVREKILGEKEAQMLKRFLGKKMCRNRMYRIRFKIGKRVESVYICQNFINLYFKLK